MDIQNLMLIGAILISTLASVIGTFKGNKNITAKAEKQRIKAIKKLEEKHKKTEETFIEEEKKLKELKKEQ